MIPTKPEMDLLKCNYHTHTARCQHAQGQDEAYVLAALAGGFSTLGFADHAPWPFASGYVSAIRMPMSELQGYLDSIRSLKEKYAEQIKIHIGLECEYFPRYRSHYDALREAGVSYFLLGQHYHESEEDNPYIMTECHTADGVKRYAEQVTKAIATGLFAYVAHPDLFMRPRRDEDFDSVCLQATEDIAQAAREANIPLEYNLLGLSIIREGGNRGYPSAPFWQALQGKGNRVILGVDAHNPAALKDTALWEDGVARVKALGFELQESLILPE